MIKHWTSDVADQDAITRQEYRMFNVEFPAGPNGRNEWGSLLGEMCAHTNPSRNYTGLKWDQYGEFFFEDVYSLQ